MNSPATNILFALIIFQLLFLSLFLFMQKRGRHISNVLLGYFFFSIALNLLDVFFLASGAYSSRPWAAGWGSCLPLLFGPLIYLYVESYLFNDFEFGTKKLIHFIPFIIFFLATEILFLLQPASVQNRLLAGLVTQQVPGAVFIISTLIFLQFIAYIIASILLIRQYRKKTSQEISNRRHANTAWLSFAVYFFLMIAIIALLNGILEQSHLSTYFLIGFNIMILAMLVFVVVVLLRALRDPEFLSVPERDPVSGSKKTELAIATAEKEQIAHELVLVMREKKPWLQPELTLQQLADQIGVKPRMLSETINELIGKNFYDFINRYRIDEAVRLLTNPKDKKITILEVLYEVGFNSKSSFNTLFKKYTGLTPTEFRRKQPR